MRSKIGVLVALALVAALAIGSVIWWQSRNRSPYNLVGSMQPALGCEQAWDFPCRATNMPETNAGTYARSFTLAAGEHEWVVGVNHASDWYSPDGQLGGARGRFVLAQEAEVTFTFDPATNQTTLSATKPGKDASEPINSLRAARTTEQFYFVMTDRFANGDPGNDRGGLEGDRMVTGYDPTSMAFYHGGDLAGLQSKLDYIQGLGTTAIWMTPSFANRPVQGTGDAASAGYHGYWITDFTRIDPHLGTNDEMKALIDAVHERGMRIYFDIIVNHTADVIAYPDGSVRYYSTIERPDKDAAGVEFDPADYADGSQPFPELNEDSFPHKPGFRTEADATARTPDWLNDVTMYHNRGDSLWTGESSLLGDFYGLDDLFTERPEVVDGMIDIYSTWAEMGIDGFRIDTVKHVNMEFWQQFGPALEEAGGDDFFMFGEVYNADPFTLSRYTTTGKLQAALDFGFQDAAVRFTNAGNAGMMTGLYDGDDYYIDADSNAYQLPTFIGNHDMGRIGMLVGGFGNADDALARSRFAHSLMFLTRGQPVVYYGDEQGFTGKGGDQAARHDMFASQVSSFDDERVLGGESGRRDHYDTDHPLYRHIASLAALRAEHPALVNGAQIVRGGASGPLVTSRIGDDRVEYVVVANNRGFETKAEVTLDSREVTLEPIFGGGSPVTVGADGKVEVSADATSVRVYRASAPLPRPNEQLTATLTMPAQLNGTLAELKAELNTPAFAEVTFQMRPFGAGEFTTLGTDDNPGYRVFTDVSGHAPGTLLEYRVVVTDAWGQVTTSPATTWTVP